jgi:hypothetical protein
MFRFAFTLFLADLINYFFELFLFLLTFFFFERTESHSLPPSKQHVACTTQGAVGLPEKQGETLQNWENFYRHAYR